MPCFHQVRLSFLFFHTWIAQNIKISEGKNMAFPGFTCELKNVGTPVNQQYKRVPRIHPALYFCVRKSRYRRIFVAWIPMLFCQIVTIICVGNLWTLHLYIRKTYFWKYGLGCKFLCLLIKEKKGKTLSLISVFTRFASAADAVWL